jgi:hypothetical protein
MTKTRRVFILLLFIPLVAWGKNGFDLSDASIPVNLIRAGGPPKDGIPAISNPQFETKVQASWLNADDRIIGVSHNGVAKAYPIRILNWHEIVNDVIGGMPVVVTFCPLCGTGMVFEATIDKDVLEFGVSGLLFESDVLLYDKKTNSLWSQLWMQAVSGSQKGQELTQVTADHTSWQDWQERYPETLVLSRETGFSRDYRRNPYAGYEARKELYFPVQNEDDSLHSKSWVLGVSVDDEHKAYTFDALKREGLDCRQRYSHRV